jgi:hypothetical protein
MPNIEELEKRIEILENKLKESSQLQEKIGISSQENKTVNLKNGTLVIPVRGVTGTGLKGELRYNGSNVYVYSGTSWVALT